MKSFMTLGKDDATSDPAADAGGGKAKLERLSVLVAETDATLSRRTAELLNELGVRDVVSVHSGAQVLEWLRTRAFDILLCAGRLGSSPAIDLMPTAKGVSPATRLVLVLAEGDPEGPPEPGVEILTRPFSRAKLGALLTRVAAPSGGLWCEVPQLSLADILQMYHQGRRSIAVLLSGPIAGRIHLSEGEIVDAAADQLRGLPALSRLLEAESGLVRTETPSFPFERTVEGPFQHMLLEAVHRLDERRRDSQLPMFGADADATPTTHTGMPVAALSTAPELLLEDVRGPSVPPPAGDAGTPEPEATASRRWPLLAALGLVVVSGLAFLGLRMGGTRGNEPNAALARGTRVEVSGRDRSTLAEASRPNPPGTPSESPHLDLPDDTPTGASPEPPQPSSPGGPAQAPVAGSAEAAARVSNSFVLGLHSKPTRARVTENGKLLGRTPLYLEIPRTSVARAPREFIVQLPGYLAYTVTQSDSAKNVRANLVLTPESGELTPDDANDGFANEPSSPDDARTKARPKGSNLEIRLRR